jgi:hypothetical protein
LLGVGAGPDDIESVIPQKQRCPPRESLGSGPVENFDLDPNSFGRFGVVGDVGRACASIIQRLNTEPGERRENEQRENESSVATPGARYLRLFQSSTVSGKM